MNRPPRTGLNEVATGGNDPGLALFSRQYFHYEAFDLLECNRLEAEGGLHWADFWEKQVIARAFQVAIVDAATGADYSYLSLDRLADAVAHWALQLHLPERVGVFQLNPVALVATLLGLAKVGRHAVVFHDNEAPARVTRLAKRLGIRAILGNQVPAVTCYSGDDILAMPWPGPVSATYRQHVKPDDTAAVLFTGGARGESKPVICSHRRFISSAVSVGQRTRMTPSDRCYLAAGLTHSESLLLGLATCFSVGAAAVIASPRVLDSGDALWLREVRGQQCSMLQYSGEFWRNAMAQLESVSDNGVETDSYTLSTVFGSGLGAEYHSQVVKRFGVKQVVEYYWAADMPDLQLFNWSNRPGHCAFIPPNHPRAEDIVLVDRAGKPVAPGEPGEALLRIHGKRFRRYLDSASYKNNIVSGVLVAGDRWWRSGDILRCDTEGFYTFVKRVNEDAEWRDEKICLARVEQALDDIGLFREIAVYTVHVPYYEERAVMASVVPLKPIYDLDLEELSMCLQATLPRQWLPSFIRMSSKPHRKTANFKIPKAPLAAKSFFYVEEADHFVLENGVYQLIDLQKLRQFDENAVEIGLGASAFGIEVPTLHEAI